MLRNFSKLLCSPSVVVRFSYYEKYQNSIGLNQTEVYFPYTGIQTPASQGDSVICAVGKVKPLLSGCSGPSPCVFCLTVPEGCCSSYHHISHPSGQQQEAGKKKCVCGGEWVGGCPFFFAGTARIASVTSILIQQIGHACQALLKCQACWRCCLHPGSQQSAKSGLFSLKYKGEEGILGTISCCL